MTYKQVKNLKQGEFKRLCRVKPRLFQEMVENLKQDLPKPKQRGGQPKLSVEDQLLIALEKRARISYLFSYFQIVGNSRIHGLQDSSSSRR